MQKTDHASTMPIKAVGTILIFGLLVMLHCAYAGFSRAEEYQEANETPSSLVEELRSYPTSLRCENLEVTTLLRAMGRQAGMTIYVSEAITSTISFEMEEATLHDVFQLIMQAKNLHYNEQGQTIIVETAEEFSKTGKDIISVSVCPDYGHASEIKTQLDTLLSPQGSITVTKHDSCLIIKDHVKEVRHLEKILTEIDQPKPQVHIEARIIMLAQEAKEALGIKWGYQNYGTDAIGDVTSKTIRAGTDLGLDAIGPSTAMAVGMVWDSMKLDAEIQAMASDDLLHILSAPSIMVLDGMEAEIKQGKEVPYTSSSTDSSTTEFREATLSLKVTPKIIKETFISMEVDVTNDKVDEDQTVAGQPLIDRQSIKTSLFLGNRATVVIGGIHVSSDDIYKGRVPGLASIPVLGELFKNRGTVQQNYELLIFLTPTIVSLDLLERASTAREKRVNTVISDDVHKKFTPKVFVYPGQELKEEEGQEGKTKHNPEKEGEDGTE